MIFIRSNAFSFDPSASSPQPLLDLSETILQYRFFPFLKSTVAWDILAYFFFSFFVTLQYPYGCHTQCCDLLAFVRQSEMEKRK